MEASQEFRWALVSFAPDQAGHELVPGILLTESCEYYSSYNKCLKDAVDALKRHGDDYAQVVIQTRVFVHRSKRHCCCLM